MHSSFSSANTPSAVGSEVSGTSDVGTQTEVRTDSIGVQTNPVEIFPAEGGPESSENLLTPSSRSLVVSLLLWIFFEKKVHSIVELSKALNSLKSLNSSFCLSESSTLKLVRITDNVAMTLEISYNMQ